MSVKTPAAPKRASKRARPAASRPKAVAKAPRDGSRTLLMDFAWAAGLAALILLIIILRDPHGRSFIYAVF